VNPGRRHPGEWRRGRTSACPWLALLLIAATLSACSARTEGAGASPRAELAASIGRILADSALARSGAAVLVVSLDRGDTLFAREERRLYTPASNRKVFTAAHALHYLGPDYRFVTPLLATGPVDSDTLRGDLVLVGRGDPDLVTGDLAALVDTLASRGVRVVAGDIRADASWFDAVQWGAGWMWDDGPYWYWPYVTALTLNDNVVEVRVRPATRAGQPPVVTLFPPTSYVRLHNEATTTADTVTTLVIDRRWAPVKENAIDVTGSIPLGVDSIVALRSVEDPALYAATVFAELLERRGIEVAGKVRHGPLEGQPADTIALHVSNPLAESVENFLEESDNLTGEILVKTVGAETAGPPGSWEKGLAAERAFLATEVGIDTTAVRLADGSGVSRYNLVTAGQIVRLLTYMAGRPDLFDAYFDALPLAGVDGTLENRMRGTPAEGVTRAKTGSLAGVSALSGYVPSIGGETLAFSVLMEFFVGPTDPRRALQDSIVVELRRFSR